MWEESKMDHIRYEIKTKTPGTIIAFDRIRRVSSTRLKSVAIVYIDSADQNEFEKNIEGLLGVLRYNAYPPAPGAALLKDWERK
jgi:hypothetical protein